MTLNEPVLFICDFDAIFTHVGVVMAINREGEYHAGIQCKISTKTHPTHYPPPKETEKNTQPN